MIIPRWTNFIPPAQALCRRLSFFYAAYGSQTNWGIIIVGILLRVWRYWQNPSLWQDEAYVALSIVNPSWKEIFCHQPFFPSQGQRTVGFYAVEKFFVDLLGNNEYALRLYPLLAGAGALVLFYFFVRRFLPARAVTLSLFFFSFSDSLIYFSAELKQYSPDIFVGLLLLLAYKSEEQRVSWTVSDGLRLAVWGSVAIWFSHTSVFFLAGIGLLLLERGIRRRDKAAWQSALLAGSLWLGNLYLLYQISLRQMLNNRYIFGTRVESFPPLQEGALKSVEWAGKAFMKMFADPAGVGFPVLAAGIFVIGCFSLYRRSREYFVLVLSPFVLSLGAAYLKKYPFSDRMILFLLPGVVILLTCGLQAVSGNGSQGRRRFLGVALGLMLLTTPVSAVIRHIPTANNVVDNRGAMSYLKSELRAGDFLMMNNSVRYSFWYYLDSLNFGEKLFQKVVTVEGEPFIASSIMGKFYDQLGVAGGKRYVGFTSEGILFNAQGVFSRTYVDKSADFDYVLWQGEPFALCSKPRVWVILSELPKDSKSLILQSLNQRGRVLQKYERTGAVVYLYDLSSH